MTARPPPSMRWRTLARLALLAPALAACTVASPSCQETSVAKLRDANGGYRLGDFTYDGPLQDGQPTGKGTVRYADGVTITGTFVRGVAQRNATVAIPGVGTITGTMRNGELVEGYATLDNGDVYHGQYRNWMPGGTGALFAIHLIDNDAPLYEIQERSALARARQAMPFVDPYSGTASR